MRPATFSSAQNSSANNSITIALWLALLVIAFVVSSIKSSKHNQEIDVWENKSKFKAILFAFLFGSFGAHRFYLNRNKSALIQLLGTITLFVSIFLFDSSSAIGTICILFGIATQLWNKLDIFLILFNGLVPFAEKEIVNAAPCEANEDIANDITRKEPDSFLDESIGEEPVIPVIIEEKNHDTEELDGNETEAFDNRVKDGVENKKGVIVQNEVDNSKYIKLLKDIDILHREGKMTDEEYQQKKAEILSRI